MSTSIILTHVFLSHFLNILKYFFANIRIRKSAPDTESWSERSDIRTPNDIPNLYYVGGYFLDIIVCLKGLLSFFYCVCNCVRPYGRAYTSFIALK
jgi:hypothetical protein